MSKSKRTSRRVRLKHGTRIRAKSSVSVKPAPWNGDQGTGTAAATEGTVVVPLEGPNRMAQRVRVNVIDTLTSLSLRQVQAAKEIQNAFGQVDSLSSGGPLKEQVDSTPKPDATMAAQVDAQSRLAVAMRAVLHSERGIVECICWNNKRPQTLSRTERRRWLFRFSQSMDRVADHLRY